MQGCLAGYVAMAMQEAVLMLIGHVHCRVVLHCCGCLLPWCMLARSAQCVAAYAISDSMLWSTCSMDNATYQASALNQDCIDEITQEAEEDPHVSSDIYVEPVADRSQIAHHQALYPQDVVLLLCDHFACTQHSAFQPDTLLS